MVKSEYPVENSIRTPWGCGFDRQDSYTPTSPLPISLNIPVSDGLPRDTAVLRPEEGLAFYESARASQTQPSCLKGETIKSQSIMTRVNTSLSSDSLGSVGKLYSIPGF